MSKYHPSSTRWFLFYDYLKKKDKYRIIYKRVWMIDVRDSYFQNDPFSFVNPHISSFHVFHGVESITISQCGWNGGWVKDCFGNEMLDQMGNNKIICSGVTVGTMDVVYEYLHLMSDIITGKKISKETGKLLQLSNSPYFPKCERNGVDQGVHNVIVHNHYLENLFESRESIEEHTDVKEASKNSFVIRWSQSNTPVCNMQAKICRVKSTDKDNISVENQKSQSVSVVHQYDRFPDLQKALFAKVRLFFVFKLSF
jgi:hypothetical protein